MTIEQLNTLIAGNSNDLVQAILKTKIVEDPYASGGAITAAGNKYEVYGKQYNSKEHVIFDKTKRTDKNITKEDGSIEKTVPVARLSVPLQKKITRTAATFLCGNPIKLHFNPKDEAETSFLSLVQKVWDDNKLDYKSKQLAKLMMRDTECAELWYTEAAEDDYWAGTNLTGSFKLRMRILAPSLGDMLYPIYTAAGDMIAFCRGYSVIVDDQTKEERFDIYTDKQLFKGRKPANATDWVFTTENLIYGKIPVVYYSQEAPEWYDVQEMIERFENKISNHADTNDYFDSPIVFVEGEINGFATKGEQGKVITGSNGATAKYLTWDQAPESTRMELDNLWRFIHTMTDTPDISFETMQKLGTFSGIALKMLFMAAHMKASEKEEIFGEGIQRRINYIKSTLAAIDTTKKKFLTMAIKPKFEYFLPKDDKEAIDILTTAVTGGIMSAQSATQQNPLIEDHGAEYELLKKEAKEKQTLENQFNQIV